MPSRRTLLGTAGAGVALALAGCTTGSERVEGYVQLKSIAGVLEGNGERVDVDVLSVRASYEPNAASPQLAHVDTDWADRFPVARAPVVSDALHEALADEFDSVRYVVGVTSPEWAEGDEPVGSFNVATTRRNFNRVQVHSAVTASSDGSSLTIHSVDGLWEFESDGG